MTSTPPSGGVVHPPRAVAGGSVAVLLSRGTVVMSEASLAALDPEMRAYLFGEADVITAEDALAELDAD